MMVLVLAGVAGASAVAAWMVDRRRCQRRNEQGECGACRVSWTETSSGELYLIHGRLVCEDCAEKAKRRMPWELGALVGWVAIVIGITLSDEGLALLAFIPAGMGIAIFGAVRLMKLANLNAQQRIATGGFPGFDALDIEGRTDATAVLSHGSSIGPDG
jgi:hypothetical protein